MFKRRSKLLFITILIESIFSGWALFYFNYLDRLSYLDSLSYDHIDIALLIENMFTSTWWALIILTFCLISIFGLIAFIYRDVKFQFASIMLWCVLFILAINFKDNVINIVSTIMLFIPILTLNIFSYFNQKKEINL